MSYSVVDIRAEPVLSKSTHTYDMYTRLTPVGADSFSFN